MAQNRVQYQKGLSVPEFFERFGTQDRCEAAVRKWRWPQGFVCPRRDGGWQHLLGRFEFSGTTWA